MLEKKKWNARYKKNDIWPMKKKPENTRALNAQQ